MEKVIEKREREIEKRDTRVIMVITPEDSKLLSALCKKKGMNRSELVRYLIRDYDDSQDLLNNAHKHWSYLLDNATNQHSQNIVKDQLIDLLLNILTQEQKAENAEKIDDFRKKISDSKNELRELIKAHKEKQK